MSNEVGRVKIAAVELASRKTLASGHNDKKRPTDAVDARNDD